MRISRGRTLLASALALLLPCAPLAHAQSGPANPQNPYDSVGQQHNAGLDAVIAMRTEVSNRKVPLAAAVVARSQDFVCGADAACRASSDLIVAAARTVGYPEEAQAEIAASLNDIQGGFFEQMVGVIDQHAQDPAALARAMAAVEAQILAEIG
jgi:hypothetical protein